MLDNDFFNFDFVPAKRIVAASLAALTGLLGGNEKFVAKLDSVFAVPNTVRVGTYGRKIHEMTEMEMAEMGQYAHG